MNAANGRHMESIYDHGVTQAELNALFYGAPEPEAEYPEGLSRDGLLVDIARLYRLRGDDGKAGRFAAMISDRSIRAEMATRGCCEGAR
jgi:hypothetical protein